MGKYQKSTFKKAVILIIISIIFEVLSAFLFIGKGEDFLVRLYYTSQIITNIFMTSGVVYAAWQYYLSIKNSQKSFAMKQVQKAIDLSEYYKDNIIKYMPAIIYVFKSSGAFPILESVKSEQMINFNRTELEQIFTQNDIDNLKQIQDSKSFTKAIIEANKIYGLNLNIYMKELHSEISDDKTATMVLINEHSVIVAFMANILTMTLNNMEYFALHFRHNTADETVIYQSLHQTYLKTVSLLYYYIAKENIKPSNEVFTNVTWLYNKWKSTHNDIENKHFEQLKNLKHTGTIIEND